MLADGDLNKHNPPKTFYGHQSKVRYAQQLPDYWIDGIHCMQRLFLVILLSTTIYHSLKDSEYFAKLGEIRRFC